MLRKTEILDLVDYLFETKHTWCSYGDINWEVLPTVVEQYVKEQHEAEARNEATF